MGKPNERPTPALRMSLSEVEGWIEVGEAVRGGGFEDVDAVDVDVFFASVADDAGEGVGEHTFLGSKWVRKMILAAA